MTQPQPPHLPYPQQQPPHPQAYPQQQPYGQQPYPQQPYPQQPQWGQPPLPPYYPPQQPVGTNGFAIAALILSIPGGFVLSTIFGFVALNQIKRTGQRGRGMAVAGLVISGIWLLGIIFGVIFAIATSATRASDGQISQGGSVAANEFKVGDCVNDLSNTSALRSLPGVPCAQPHEGEVFAIFNLPDGSYPGRDEIESQASSECSTQLDEYAPSAATDENIGLYYVYPQERNWSVGDREVVCIATSDAGPTTGSIRGR
jgi:hypothetical protein